MKSKLLLFILIISTVYIFNACEDSGTDPENGEGGTQVADASYFPNEDGAFYKYNIQRDSAGTVTSGTRSSFYSGNQTVGGTPYQLQLDTLNFQGLPAILDSLFFRKTNSGVFYFLDTTGFASSVPGLDTLIQYITLDTEVRILLFPMLDNSSWSVFRMNLNYQGILNFDPVVLSARYDGTENLQLNLNPPKNVDAVKLRFTLSIKTDPFGETTTYTTYGWIAQNIGFVKWEGNGTIIGLFTGNGVDFDDTTSVFTQNIIEFNLIDN